MVEEIISLASTDFIASNIHNAFIDSLPLCRESVSLNENERK
jgi:hypothetical protein